MPENTGIVWASDLRHARHEPNPPPTSLPASQDQSRPAFALSDMSQSDGSGETRTQRNTPIALPARDPVEFTEDDDFRTLDAVTRQDMALSAPHSSLPSSTQTSSSSLKAMSDREVDVSHGRVRRALSARSSYEKRARGPSHTKSGSLSLSPSGQAYNDDRPSYPNQSFAALHFQHHPVRPTPPLRSRSSHPAQNALYTSTSTWQPSADRFAGSYTTKTADNTPVSSPGLFSAPRIPSGSSLKDVPAVTLHRLQVPRVTNTAEIDYDVFSGNKFINNYEMIELIGRGEYGKVKLGRDVERENLVAVKIVPRFARQRRLGRLGAPEDRTKREIAVLKKARHENVVSLLEVIDDPSKNKVYLILEYVPNGEIKWRKMGVPAVLAVYNARFARETKGLEPLEPTVHELKMLHDAKKRHDMLERARAMHPPNWSLELAGEEADEDDHLSDISRSASRQFNDSGNPTRTSSHDEFDLSGSMYGAYAPDAYRPTRKFSIAQSAVSHMSSEWNKEEEPDEETGYVPAMTLDEARRAFRDTLLGLEFLHYIGIIHRDIKPANLLVAANGQVKISDFGVSYFGRPISDEDPENKLTEKDVSALDDEKELARTVGTPAFWAPELCYDASDSSVFSEEHAPRITGALDLWALGITLYCMIYARLPFYPSEEMGLHEAVCKAEVICPKTRLVPVDTTKDKPSSQIPCSINSNKRLDYELKFESIPEGLRDLIRKLLVKDPAQRMTIAEAKRHPWVLEGVNDLSSWIKRGPHLEMEAKTKILEVDEKEMTHAVSKRNLIERTFQQMGNTVNRLAESLLGRSNTRKRATSTATSTSHSSESLASPSGSSGSTVGRADKDRLREGRRTSLRGDEVLTALHKSRDVPEHPLAQSQTASPDTPDRASYFAASLPEPKSASTGATPSLEPSSRPRGPDRSISTADSVLTIRASQMHRLPLPVPETVGDGGPSSSAERGFRAKVDGLWEGTAKSLARLGSRDRRSHRLDHSPAPSLNSSESDAHAGPSLAVSTASASGAIEPPDVLKNTLSPVDYNVGPPTLAVGVVAPHHKSEFQAPESSQEAFEQAQEINQRRLVQEVQAKADAAVYSQGQSPTDSCPPSPDDIDFLEKQHAKLAGETSGYSSNPSPIQAEPSASTIASSVDEFGDSSVTQSMSEPSFGIVSNASSPPNDGFYAPSDQAKTLADTHSHKEAEPDFMRTADTTETVTKRGTTTQVATGASLQQWGQDTAYEGDDNDYDYDEDDDSEEEGMMMGGPRSVRH